MMTCRLLCALLVLALCCCPSVCAAETEEITVDLEAEDEVDGRDNRQSPHAPGIPMNQNQTQAESPEAAPSLPPPPSVAQSQGTGQPGSSSNGAAAKHGNNAGDTGTLPGPHSQSSGAHNTVQREGTEDTSGEKSGASTSTEQAIKKVDDSAETTMTTTTTTTKAPTTTTTTTTTEAPTTTTTRAPSRLREVDGSLSSSAWVCAPLLLAASALAYTAVG
ncbi:putative mucin TcMUCII [Trypanosoma cruzi]|uniref:Mucin TcMUCII, putative n=2 Tax=Trypanosoma cruzi TaxID=5693 RepID=Q4DF00_TRYCC|nr:mucin TcMUCII, putative [Trypanosoma cruzi]EAN91096.1 mucin TcMUCII, putative [Trypanosoma cruzi]PWV14230.1 putative mucin TcMUCII [Trypanosoma cruzi]|eukprot:XP_812947.1 mucin TcMUCII [Trypanosoma cruzi strain CL Brener]